MENIIRLFLIFCLPFAGGAQINFYKLYTNNGNDFGQGVVQLEDSSYVITGSSSSFGNSNASQAFLMKIDSLGNHKWAKNYGGIETEWGRRVLYAPQKYFYISGYTNSSGYGGYDFYLVKTDLKGNKIWEKTYGKAGWEKVNDAVLLADTSILMVGQSTSNEREDNDIYIVRTDKNGDTLWTKQINNVGNDFATSIKKVNETVYMVAGQIYNTDSTFYKAFLMRLNINGTVEWIRQYGKKGNYVFNDIAIVGDHIDFVGHRKDGLSGLTDGILGQVMLLGPLSYSFEDPFNGYDSFELITTYKNASKVFVTSNQINANTYLEGKDLFLIRLNESMTWDNNSTNCSNTGDDIGGQIIGTSDGGVLLVGYNSNFGAGGNNVFALKIGGGNPETFPTTSGEPLTSTLVSVKTIDQNLNLKLYPNPSNGILNFSYADDLVGKIEICDIRGKVVLESELVPSLNCTNFESGSYFVRITDSKGNFSMNKISIEHQ